MTKKIHFILLSLVIILAVFLRFYKLDEVPAGLHADEVSQGFNAYSLMLTGKDRYGQSLPILFRSNGSYQPPLYTYLTIVPVSLFGNTIFAVRFISAFSGSVLVLITYFVLLSLFKEKRERFGIALLGSLVVAISPWGVFFSRLAVEASLGVSLFVLSLLLFISSVNRKFLFIVACLVLGLSTHAYYSERLIAVIFLPLWMLMFRKKIAAKWAGLGLGVFAITLLPHIATWQSGAFANRFSQVSLAGSGNLVALSLLLGNYLTYFSPRNLFFDSGANLGRLMPDLSTFYNWMLVPFFWGSWFLLKSKLKIIALLLIVTLMPAGLTGDVFYPLRTLDFLWVATLVIALGIHGIYTFITRRNLKKILLGFVIFYSLFSLYISYFILFKYETSGYYGYSYLKLWDKLKGYPSKHIVIDSARDPGIGLRLAYLNKYDPQKIQQQLRNQMQSSYYSSYVNSNESYVIGNVAVKSLDWGEACKKDYLFVGDRLAISDKDAVEHRLKLEFEISDLAGQAFLGGYFSDLNANCR